MKKYVLFAVAGILISCTNAKSESADTLYNSNTEATALYSATDATAENDRAEATNPNAPGTKKIIETDIWIHVKNVPEARQKIQQIITKYNAEVSTETYADNHLELTFYAPRKNYDTLISQFTNKNFDDVYNKSVRVLNITQPYYALKNQLNSDAILIAKYQELLKKSENVQDVLAIYERIEDLERQKHNHADEMAYYNYRQDYNLVTLHVAQPNAEVEQSAGFGTKIGNALANGWYLIQHLFLGMLSIWPIFIIIALLIFGIKKIKVKKNKS